MLLHHSKGSTVLAWPGELVPVPYYDDAFYVRFARDVKKYVFLTILTWEKVEAVCFTWHSVSGLANAFPLACNDLPPATRAVVTEQPQPLAELAARKAFGTMDLTSLRDNAKFIKTGIKTSDTMLNSLIALARYILKCSEAEALDIASQRLVTLDEEVGELDELMEIGEAVDCLDAADVKNVQQTQVKHADRCKEYVSVRDALLEESKRVVEAVGGAGRPAKKAKAAPKRSSSLAA